MRREKMKMLCSHVQALLHSLHYPVAASKMSRISRYRWKKGILKQWRLTFEMLFSTFVRLIQLPAQLLSLSLFLCTGFACFLSHDGGCVWSHKGSVAASGTQENTGVSQRVSDEFLACNCWTIHIDNKILTYLNNQQSRRKRCLAASWRSTDGSETLDAHD